MSCIERVAAALERRRKARHTAVAAQRGKTVGSAGEQLVCVALMTNIKNKVVMLRVEYAMKRDGSLDHSEIRGKMSAVLRR